MIKREVEEFYKSKESDLSWEELETWERNCWSLEQRIKDIKHKTN